MKTCCPKKLKGTLANTKTNYFNTKDIYLISRYIFFIFNKYKNDIEFTLKK